MWCFLLNGALCYLIEDFQWKCLLSKALLRHVVFSHVTTTLSVAVSRSNLQRRQKGTDTYRRDRRHEIRSFDETCCGPLLAGGRQAKRYCQILIGTN